MSYDNNVAEYPRPKSRRAQRVMEERIAALDCDIVSRTEDTISVSYPDDLTKFQLDQVLMHAYEYQLFTLWDALDVGIGASTCGATSKGLTLIGVTRVRGRAYCLRISYSVLRSTEQGVVCIWKANESNQLELAMRAMFGLELSDAVWFPYWEESSNGGGQ